MGADIANTNPWISSVSKHMNGVPFKEFPKAFIAAGDLEVSRDQVTILKGRMEGDIGENNIVVCSFCSPRLYHARLA